MSDIDSQRPAPADPLPVETPSSELPDAASNDPSLGLLLRELTDDGRRLIRQEVSLASLEISRSVTALARMSAIAAVGGFMVALGLLILVVFVILALGSILGGAYWMSTLIVGGILLLAGALTLRSGRKGLRENELKPRRTMASIQETRDWAESRTKRVRR